MVVAGEADTRLALTAVEIPVARKAEGIPAVAEQMEIPAAAEVKV